MFYPTETSQTQLYASLDRQLEQEENIILLSEPV